MIDQSEIINALRLWFRPGDVFEIRALDAVTADYMRPHVESGYFDYEHIDDVPKALSRLRACRGVYVTLNPVNPALLARAKNRIRSVGREPTTTDADIPCRRWLPIDCDAERPAGISSDAVEHEAAQKKAQEIKAGLAQLGWPEPVMIDSGNGAQLLYAVDLPAKDDQLVQKFLAEIAVAGDEQVKIDLSVHNPARIWRLPGTMNCKGDHTDERPHRMAKIVFAPECAEIVPRGLLEAIIAPPAQPSIVAETGSAFDLDGWIAARCPELGASRPWKDGRRWLFPVCPFNPDHTDKSAVLIEHGSGAVSFRCHHNGCAGKDWRELRELLEPGCYDAPKPDPGVDFSGILASPKTEIVVPDEPEIVRPWRQVSTADIRQALAGTFLGELAALYASVSRPPLPLEGALMKALVTAGCSLTGEASSEELQRRYGGNLGAAVLLGADRAKLKINTAGGQVCNVYGMIAANSASGKDIGNLIGKFSRMHNPDVRCADGENIVADWDLGTSGSAEGLAYALTKKPNGLLSISELANWLDPHHWQNKATGFLTEAFGQGYYNQSFSDRGRGGSSRRVDYCCPNIIANIQPNVFDQMVRLQDIYTGFLGRFLFVKMMEHYGNPAKFDSRKMMEEMRVIVEVFLRKRGVVELEEDYSDSLQQMFLGNCDPKLNPSWRRLCNEYYPRFMVMLSVTHSVKTQGESVVITDNARERARLMVLWFFNQAEQMLTGVSEDVGNSREVEHRLKRLFEIVRDHDRGSGLLVSEISRKASGSGTTAKQRQDLLLELCERQWVNFEGNRFKVLYPPPHLAKVRKKVM
jgi:hypothetical protein